MKSALTKALAVLAAAVAASSCFDPGSSGADSGPSGADVGAAPSDGGAGVDVGSAPSDAGAGVDAGAAPSDAGTPADGGCAGDAVQACGKCGTQTRTCSGGQWTDWSACAGEIGVCVPGTSEACGADGTQTCATSCKWDPCVCAGAATQSCTCTTGAAVQTRTCAAGTWSPWSACVCTAAGYADVSCGEGDNSGWYPTAVIDQVNSKLLFVTQNRARNFEPYLFRCALDGTGCVATSLGPARTGGTPQVMIDAAAGKLMVVTQNDSSSSRPLLYRCNLDGTSCSSSDLSAGLGAMSGYEPSAAIDAKNGKLLVVSANGADQYKPVLFRCELDGTACASVDISAGQGRDSGNFPSTAIDTVNDKLLVVTMNGSNGNRPSLFRCNLDGTGCTHTDISAGQGAGSGADSDVVIDPVNDKLIVATANSANGNRASLFRCNLDGTGCTHHGAISAGTPGGTGVLASMVVDVARQQVLVAMRGGMSTPLLARCSLDCDTCALEDLSGGQIDRGAFQLAAALDTVNDKVLVVVNDPLNGYTPALFTTTP